MNILNPALTVRAFLFFAYPAQLSGDKVWTAAFTTNNGIVDGISQATLLGIGVLSGVEGIKESFTWMDSFIGNIFGFMGESFVIVCLLGAALLIGMGIGSWCIMVACIVGMFATCSLLNAVDAGTNLMMSMSFYWHLVIGGFAFGTVFMATDPVSASMTEPGKLAYGFLIGMLCCLIRVVNFAYLEGMMLAILFMNIFVLVIDYMVVQ